MIVRVMGEGQWRVDDACAATLNELDDQVGEAVDAGDQARLSELLRQMGEIAKRDGEKLADEDLSASDAIVPPEDLSLDEARELLTGEGLIPDLPSGAKS